MTQTTAPATVIVRNRLAIRGVVQGVGFRPHLSRLAVELGLTGTCHNDASCVIAEVEGPESDVIDFERRLVAEAPPLARITSLHSAPVAVIGSVGFVIEPSDQGTGARTMVPPDAAICEDCLRELRDPTDRRYRHPFITCTHCGPRFTIAEDLPYDRPSTTMAGFPLCPECAEEYANPQDRRFHAQPISCHACGPQLSWIQPQRPETKGEEALAAARRVLEEDGIVAVKGVGGYHLFCLATSSAAVRRLRELKHRPHQPFALMVSSLEEAHTVAVVPPAAEQLLTGTERPIVLLKRTPGSSIVDEVAPALDELGVMVAYTPLHHLLLEGLPPLVATSGNAAGEPLAWRDQDAVERLGAIADGFLVHDRPIAVPCDDSVVRWREHGPILSRRSRGYAPLPIQIPTGPVVLAAGADLKNTVTLTRDGQAWTSGHLGDLGDLAARRGQEAAVSQMLRFHQVAPALVVADLHPGYVSRQWATKFAEDLGAPLHLVQHHHAHLAALATEHERLGQPMLGLVLDGTGYGCDAQVWGGELLALEESGRSARRIGHLAELPLPGGDSGVRNPVRLAAAALAELGAPITGLADLNAAEATLFGAPGLWPRTSSAGRLFDVVSALLGVRSRVSYEAQAAVELEALATRAGAGPLLTEPQLRTGEELVLQTQPWLTDLMSLEDDPGRLAYAFHNALADGLARLAIAGAARTGLDTVGLSGGVFANVLLLDLLIPRLTAAGLEVLTHQLVPPGDGGISLGQAAIGLAVAASTTAPASPAGPAQGGE